MPALHALRCCPAPARPRLPRRTVRLGGHAGAQRSRGQAERRAGGRVTQPINLCIQIVGVWQIDTLTYSIYLEREIQAANEVGLRHEIERVLSDRGLTADTDGRIEVSTGDGGSAEVDVADAELVVFNYVWLSRELAALMFAIAQCGYRVFGENSERALTTFPARVKEVYSDPETDPDWDWPVVLCSSPDAMHDALTEPFEGWVEYRDQVVAAANEGVVRRLVRSVLRR